MKKDKLLPIILLVIGIVFWTILARAVLMALHIILTGGYK